MCIALMGIGIFLSMCEYPRGEGDQKGDDDNEKGECDMKAEDDELGGCLEDWECQESVVTKLTLKLGGYWKKIDCCQRRFEWQW